MIRNKQGILIVYNVSITKYVDVSEEMGYYEVCCRLWLEAVQMP